MGRLHEYAAAAHEYDGTLRPFRLWTATLEPNVPHQPWMRRKKKKTTGPSTRLLAHVWMPGKTAKVGLAEAAACILTVLADVTIAAVADDGVAVAAVVVVVELRHCCAVRLCLAERAP